MAWLTASAGFVDSFGYFNDFMACLTASASFVGLTSLAFDSLGVDAFLAAGCLAGLRVFSTFFTTSTYTGMSFNLLTILILSLKNFETFEIILGLTVCSKPGSVVNV